MSVPPGHIKLQKRTPVFWRDLALHVFSFACGSLSGGLCMREVFMVKKKNKRTIILSGFGALVGFAYYWMSYDKLQIDSDEFNSDRYIDTIIVNYKTDKCVKE